MSVSFGGQELGNASVWEDDAGIICNATRLLSGKIYIQASAETSFTPSFSCLTEDASEITALRGKIGTGATLTINDDSYSNCYIKTFKSKEFAPGKYQYSISFVRHTA